MFFRRNMTKKIEKKKPNKIEGRRKERSTKE